MQNILTVDVEEVFHAEYARSSGRGGGVFRTPYNVSVVLDLLDDYDVKATFFVVGQVAERYPWVLKEVTDRGHEVAFHSYDHRPLWEKSPKQLKTEMEAFDKLLVATTGDRYAGFRAPSFSLDNGTKWVLDVLEGAGMQYDSSVFPAWTPLYGLSNAPVKPYKPSRNDLTVEDDEGDLWEFPLAVYSFLGLRIPAAGGFYLRFIPSLVWRAVNKINILGSPAVIYIHNWELDPETPKLNLNPFKSFVTYHNIEKTSAILKQLLSSFEFTSIRNYVKETGLV